MRWPWTQDAETLAQHQEEIDDVKERLDAIEDVLADELAVLQRNGPDGDEA